MAGEKYVRGHSSLMLVWDTSSQSIWTVNSRFLFTELYENCCIFAALLFVDDFLLW